MARVLHLSKLHSWEEVLASAGHCACSDLSQALLLMPRCHFVHLCARLLRVEPQFALDFHQDKA